METQHNIESLFLQYGFSYTNSINFYRNLNGDVITFDLSNKNICFEDNNKFIELHNNDITLKNIEKYLKKLKRASKI